VAKDPPLDLSTLTYDWFTQLFQQSRAEYDKVIGTETRTSRTSAHPAASC
jgi:feruloyl esterase